MMREIETILGTKPKIMGGHDLKDYSIYGGYESGFNFSPPIPGDDYIDYYILHPDRIDHIHATFSMHKSTGTLHEVPNAIRYGTSAPPILSIGEIERRTSSLRNEIRQKCEDRIAKRRAEQLRKDYLSKPTEFAEAWGKSATPETVMHGKSDDQQTNLLNAHSAFLLGDAVDFENPERLVSEFLPRNGVALIYAAPGAGKSLIAQDLVSCIGQGRNWHVSVIKFFGTIEPVS